MGGCIPQENISGVESWDSAVIVPGNNLDLAVG